MNLGVYIIESINLGDLEFLKDLHFYVGLSFNNKYTYDFLRKFTSTS